MRILVSLLNNGRFHPDTFVPHYGAGPRIRYATDGISLPGRQTGAMLNNDIMTLVKYLLRRISQGKQRSEVNDYQ